MPPWPEAAVRRPKGAAMTATIVLDEQVTFVTDPVNPCAAAEFTVSWQERNIGDAASAEYQDIFDLDDQGSGDSKSIQCDQLPPGETAVRTIAFTLPAGNYVMTLVINGVGPLTLGNVIVNDCVDSADTSADQP
jgi:hypothetical protein